jgi:tRNA pseudouridine38/39 synthase
MLRVRWNPFRSMSSLASRVESYSQLSKEELIQKIIALENTFASAPSPPSIASEKVDNTILSNHDTDVDLSSLPSQKRPLSPSSTSPVAGSIVKKPKKPQRSFDLSKYTTRRVALRVVYFGWNYHGLAAQVETTPRKSAIGRTDGAGSLRELDTIEFRLFQALLKVKLIDEDIKKCNWTKCGRTDKGVSAYDQVVALDIRSNQKQSDEPTDDDSELNYIYMLNRHLPSDIRVYAWAPVPKDFSARFDCQYRRYHYFFPNKGLDLDKMQAACELLKGEHDFRNFCKFIPSSTVRNFERVVMDAAIRRVPARQGERLQFSYLDIKGTAFLWHQVRCIMGLLFLIGRGKEDPRIIKELFDITKHPAKPEYEMASEIPLVLCESGFDLAWRTGPESSFNVKQHGTLVDHCNELWREHQTRAYQLEFFIHKLEGMKLALAPESSTEATGHCPFNEFHGLRHKTYTPLLNRKRCREFGERIKEHELKLANADQKPDQC